MEKSEETSLYQRARIEVGLDWRGEAGDASGAAGRVEGEVPALSSTPAMVLRQIRDQGPPVHPWECLGVSLCHPALPIAALGAERLSKCLFSIGAQAGPSARRAVPCPYS